MQRQRDGLVPSEKVSVAGPVKKALQNDLL